MRFSLARPALFLLTAVSAACADGTGTDEAGTYVLRTVGDSTLPYVAVAEPFLRQIVVAETLTVDGHGGLTMSHVESDTWPGQWPTTIRIVTAGRYRRFGNQVRYVFACPLNALCAVVPSAYRLSGSGLTTVNLVASDTMPVRFYERIR